MDCPAQSICLTEGSKYQSRDREGRGGKKGKLKWKRNYSYNDSLSETHFEQIVKSNSTEIRLQRAHNTLSTTVLWKREIN